MSDLTINGETWTIWRVQVPNPARGSLRGQLRIATFAANGMS